MMMKIAVEKALPFDPVVPNQKTIEALRAAQRGDLIPVASPADLFSDVDEEDD
jgi:DNA-damage-inducible protein J